MRKNLITTLSCLGKLLLQHLSILIEDFVGSSFILVYCYLDIVTGLTTHDALYSDWVYHADIWDWEVDIDDLSNCIDVSFLHSLQEKVLHISSVVVLVLLQVVEFVSLESSAVATHILHNHLDELVQVILPLHSLFSFHP